MARTATDATALMLAPFPFNGKPGATKIVYPKNWDPDAASAGASRRAQLMKSGVFLSDLLTAHEPRGVWSSGFSRSGPRADRLKAGLQTKAAS